MKCEFCQADKDNYYEMLGSPCCEKQRASDRRLGLKANYPEIPQFILKLARLVKGGKNETLQKS